MRFLGINYLPLKNGVSSKLDHYRHHENSIARAIGSGNACFAGFFQGELITFFYFGQAYYFIAGV